jgi:hypothetical protein
VTTTAAAITIKVMRLQVRTGTGFGERERRYSAEFVTVIAAPAICPFVGRPRGRSKIRAM